MRRIANNNNWFWEAWPKRVWSYCGSLGPGAVYQDEHNNKQHITLVLDAEVFCSAFKHDIHYRLTTSEFATMLLSGDLEETT